MIEAEQYRNVTPIKIAVDRVYLGIKLVMKARRKKVGMGVNKPVKDYPDQTAGSRLAAKIRAKANKLTDQQRADLFRRGLAMIYGSAAKKTVSARH